MNHPFMFKAQSYKRSLSTPMCLSDSVYLGWGYSVSSKIKQGKAKSDNVMKNYYYIQDFDKIQPITLWNFHRCSSMENSAFLYY